MLKGYDKAEAVALILSRIYAEDYPSLPEGMLPDLIGQCVDADFAYMDDFDIMRKDGSFGECFYNNNNAHCSISAELIRNNHLTGDSIQDVFQLVDDYMDFNRSYLEKKGLKYHIDERLQHELWHW